MVIGVLVKANYDICSTLTRYPERADFPRDTNTASLNWPAYLTDTRDQRQIFPKSYLRPTTPPNNATKNWFPNSLRSQTGSQNQLSTETKKKQKKPVIKVRVSSWKSCGIN